MFSVVPAGLLLFFGLIPSTKARARGAGYFLNGMEKFSVIGTN
jgi:hypothetical protein